MTRLIKEDKFIPVTLIKVPELRVFHVKTIEIDGYEAVVLEIVGSDVRREFTKTGILENVKKDDLISLDLLDGINEVTVVGISKGKGFAGAMKRHNFSGGPGRVGSKFHRALGSIGNRKPRRTKPGKKMHGHMGTDRVTLKHVPLELVNKEIGVIAIKGPVPGARNSLVVLNF